jgi:methionine-rich copper-binding protein CopC
MAASMRRRRRSIAAGIAALTLAGCAGNGEGLDANGRPLGEAGPDGPIDGPLVATFESIQAHVFTPACAGCHSGATAPQGLRLDATSSYDLLVGVASSEVPTLQRVQPGDPDRSYLVQKLEGRAAVGARMPLGGPYLEQATIDVIRQWISDGAARATPAGAVATKPLALAHSTPANGDVLAQAPRRIVVAFTQDLDVTRLDRSTVHLARVLDRDATALASLPVSVHAVPTNPRTVVVTAQSPLLPGRYVVQLRAAGLASLDGQPLGAATGTGAPNGVRIVFEVEDQP